VEQMNDINVRILDTGTAAIIHVLARMLYARRKISPISLLLKQA